MKRLRTPQPDDPYVTEERLCLIEDGCKVDRPTAERLHRERLAVVAGRGVNLEMGF